MFAAVPDRTSKLVILSNGLLGAVWLWDHARHWSGATFKEYVVRKEHTTFLDVALPVLDWIRGARLDGMVQWRPRVEAFINAVA